MTVAITATRRRTRSAITAIAHNFGGADSGVGIDPNYKGKGLQLHLTVEDEGVFTMPWSAIATYRRGLAFWPERVCAENLAATYIRRDSDVPRAYGLNGPRAAGR